MVGIFFQDLITFESQFLYRLRKRLKTFPEIWRGKVFQSSRLFPRLCADNVFAANFSSLPA
jgi:hypothetical protein